MMLAFQNAGVLARSLKSCLWPDKTAPANPSEKTLVLMGYLGQ
jgi:hypothetical protein